MLGGVLKFNEKQWEDFISEVDRDKDGCVSYIFNIYINKYNRLILMSLKECLALYYAKEHYLEYDLLLFKYN